MVVKLLVPSGSRRPAVRGRPARWRALVEILEPRQLLATFVVNTAADIPSPGMVTLRDAITLSNSTPGPQTNTIDFDISGSTIPIISPTSALPTITQPVIIDGTSEPDFGIVALAGNQAGNGGGSGVNGLTISAGSSVVQGLIIGLFSGSGILLTTSGGNLVRGCVLGTDLLSDTGIGNSVDGILIGNSAGNTIGGADAASRNILSGNGAAGIGIGGPGSTGNLIEGNFIGTDTTGMSALSNTGPGIFVFFQAAANTIGGASAGARNVISGNRQNGIGIASGADGNVIVGNFIGTNAIGNGPLTGSGLPSNGMDGITIDAASDNTIGGTDTGAANLIGINGSNGVNIFSPTDGTDTTGNVILGNRIGTDINGTLALGNIASGILIATTQGTVVGGSSAGAGNVVSANGQSGIELALGDTGSLIAGNRIGTDLGGTHVLSNVGDGLLLDGASNCTVGGLSPGAGNVISANSTGIHVVGNAGGSSSDSADDVIVGNMIGADITGTQILSNLGNGILIQGARRITVGGTTAAARNVISANNASGIMILVSSAILVQGNDIGVDASGSLPLDNTDNGVTVSGSTGVVIGGTASGAGNVIGRNDKDGVAIEFASKGTIVQGNLIGLVASGLDIASNRGNGVSVDDSTATTIGGMSAAARNVIAANGSDGIKVTNFSDETLVQGNYVGVDATGMNHLANLGNGVEVTNSAQNVTIGGTTAAARNIISGNQGSGVVLSIGSGVGNTVKGNFIGTDVTGTQDLGNRQYGVLVSQSQSNVIGGSTPGTGSVPAQEGNVIAGNQLTGVFILGNLATGNVVEGNLIGTDVTGATALNNAQGGVAIGSAATANTIGGTTPGARNVISGNLTYGVTIAGQGTSNNLVEGNLIGTDATGLHPIRNFLSGVFIQDAAGNTVGGTSAVAGNLISANGQDGITVANSSATGNLIELNAIGTDLSLARTVDSSGRSLGNAGNGITINSAPGNTVALNLISGNAGNGLALANVAGGPGQAITVAANLIGSDVSGTHALGNTGDGILLDNVSGQTIGGSAAATNLISANGVAGIEIRGAGSTANVVQGNEIGTTLGGKAALGNAIGVNLNGTPGNTIAVNLISGNSLAAGGGVGVQIIGTGAAGNRVVANLVGTDITGTQAVANDIGILISGAPGNTIAANVISGNIRADTSGIGIEIVGTGATKNVVQGNNIGTNQAGTRTLVAAQPDLGILISDTPGNNTLGGTGAGLGNVISGFKVGVEVFAAQSQFNPTPGTTIQGNRIGTDATGAVALGNEVGIYINGVPRNLIGGTAPGAGNIISGNTIAIYLLGSTTTGNQIQGNLIGLDAAGKVPLGNYIGVYLDAASSNLIGGTAPGARNFIAGDKRNGPDGSTGVYAFNKAQKNQVQGNSIGTALDGRSGKGLGMGDYGVLLFNAPNNGVPRGGKARNRILGSGIAAFREFTGSTRASAASTVTRPATVRLEGRPAGPVHFARRAVSK
jgi:hypothetical protein